jgi:hypothetical protein
MVISPVSPALLKKKLQDPKNRRVNPKNKKQIRLVFLETFMYKSLFPLIKGSPQGEIHRGNIHRGNIHIPVAGRGGNNPYLPLV